MATVYYPDLKQYSGSDRTDVTTILVSTAESGALRARTFFTTPRYELTLVHETVTQQEYEDWEDWWVANRTNKVIVRWEQDQQYYEGLFISPPVVSYSEPYYYRITNKLNVMKI